MPSTMYAVIQEFGADGRNTTIDFPSGDVTAANYDARVTLVDAWHDVIADIIIGTFAQTSLKSYVNEIADIKPANQFAQREERWTITMRGDSTGRLYQRSIPTANLALLSSNGEDMADGAVRTALVSFYELNFRGINGETIDVESVKYTS